MGLSDHSKISEDFNPIQFEKQRRCLIDEVAEAEFFEIWRNLFNEYLRGQIW